MLIKITVENTPFVKVDTPGHIHETLYVKNDHLGVYIRQIHWLNNCTTERQLVDVYHTDDLYKAHIKTLEDGGTEYKVYKYMDLTDSYDSKGAYTFCQCVYDSTFVEDGGTKFTEFVHHIESQGYEATTPKKSYLSVNIEFTYDVDNPVNYKMYSMVYAKKDCNIHVLNKTKQDLSYLVFLDIPSTELVYITTVYELKDRSVYTIKKYKNEKCKIVLCIESKEAYDSYIKFFKKKKNLVEYDYRIN